jgi:hypothetical protein
MGMSIGDIISKFINNWSSKEELYLKLGTATEINEDEFTFKFTPIDEKSIVEDVRMKSIVDGSAEAFVIVPKEGSKVVVGFHSNTVGQCLMVQEAEKILINSNIILESSTSKTVNAEEDLNINCNDVNVTTDSWDFNDGTLGGLIIINDLTTKLNKLVTEVNDLKTKFNTHVHPGVTIGAGATGVTSVFGIDATSFDKDDYENTKINH